MSISTANLKRSPWTKPFSTEVPAQPGVYECEWDGRRDIWFNYWDGKFWHWGSAEPQLCDKDDPISAGMVAEGMRRWRGITRAAYARSQSPGSTAGPATARER